MLVVKEIETWGTTNQQRWHAEALQKFGERVIVRHRWNIRDYAEGRVARCTLCSGGLRLNEKQRLRVLSTSGGTFTLTFAGQETTPLPWDASATETQAALVALEVNHPGDVLVTGTNINDDGLVVEFKGQWAFVETIPNVTPDSSGLFSSDASVEVIQLQAGSGGASDQARFSAVYKQAGDSWCTACYAVGFEGGYEPIIYVTFALISDQQQETTHGVGGAIQRENPKVQFSFEPQVEEFDLMARVESWESDNITPRELRGRFQLGEVQPVTLRTGPGTPSDSLAIMPAELATRFQMPNRDWVIGQTCGIENLPWDHVGNLVPLSRAEERLVEEGMVPARRWYQKAATSPPFSPGMTKP